MADVTLDVNGRCDGGRTLTTIARDYLPGEVSLALGAEVV